MLARSLIFLILVCGLAEADQRENRDMKTVIGPKNPELASGAEALMAGRVESGIRLTRIGLENASGPRERQAAYSNLCAGYLMLRQFETAIGYCDLALEEDDRNWRALSNRALARTELGDYENARRDIERGEAIAPKSSKLKEVRAYFLDLTEPVAPTITIDDRRDEVDEDEENESV